MTTKRVVAIEELHIDEDLIRTRSSKVFEEHLRQSIAAGGLAEPLKVAKDPRGRLVVVDGVLRLRALRSLNEKTSDAHARVPVYIVPFETRYEIRYQTDIYQDLLPSQLARLVEHLHKTEKVSKKEIARLIGVSASTLRNYTGLWRLVQRKGLFGRVVELMDRGILPASNPYAWLRLTPRGLELALESLSGGAPAEQWTKGLLEQGPVVANLRYSIKEVQAVTDSLPADCYRENQRLREVKKDLGLRRRKRADSTAPDLRRQARRHLKKVGESSRDRVLTTAAQSLSSFLT